jgi:hypothetical protein
LVAVVLLVAVGFVVVLVSVLPVVAAVHVLPINEGVAMHTVINTVSSGTY